jgi:hypothetical protein
VLDGNNIGSLAFASNLTGFTEVSFQNTGIKDISPLANKTNLIFLDISYNLITNLSLLTGLGNLTTLILDGTGLRDVSFLTNLPNLQNLSIANNDIQDLSPLLKLHNLSSVDIYGNGLNLSAGSTNAAAVATLQNRGVYIPSLQQVSQPFILSGSPRLSAPGGALIQFSGVPGRYYNIQSSSNLVTWTNLTNVLCTSMATSFCDSNYAKFKQQFYRIQAASGATNLAPPVVTLGLPVKTTNGNYSLPVTANGARTFVLQSSPDLTNWSSLSTNTSVNGSLMVDGAAYVSALRFYRLWFP